jgi:hypothetical protein
MTRRVTELHNKRGGYTRNRLLCLTHTHNRCIEKFLKSEDCILMQC